MNARTLLLAGAALLAACRSNTAPEQSTPTTVASEVVVALGDTVALGQTGIRVTFRAVLEDSRCPVDAVCVWSGNARIALDVIAPSGAKATGLLNTTTGDRSLVFTGYRIELLDLDPHPVANQQAPAYQARLSWQFLPD